MGVEWIAEIPGGTKAELLIIGRTANAHRHGFARVQPLFVAQAYGT